MAVELHYADDANPLLPEAYAKLKGKARVCLNTQQQGLAGSHVDQRRGDDPEVVWGTLIRQGATLIVSDQIKPFLRYLRSDSGAGDTGCDEWCGCDRAGTDRNRQDRFQGICRRNASNWQVRLPYRLRLRR